MKNMRKMVIIILVAVVVSLATVPALAGDEEVWLSHAGMDQWLEDNSIPYVCSWLEPGWMGIEFENGVVLEIPERDGLIRLSTLKQVLEESQEIIPKGEMWVSIQDACSILADTVSANVRMTGDFSSCACIIGEEMVAFFSEEWSNHFWRISEGEVQIRWYVLTYLKNQLR